VDVERTDLLPFVRFGQREGVNLRLGYRMFDYEISNARLDETRNSRLTRRIRDGQAEGDMASGLDAELNLTFGESFQFGLMLGATYFKDAEFDWQYRDDLAGGRVERGSVEADAVSLRFGPEIAFRLADELRLYANFVVAGTSWIGSEADDAEDYAGVDVMASVGLGLRYQFGD